VFDPLAESENETVIAELTRRSGVEGIDNMLDGFTDIVTSMCGRLQTLIDWNCDEVIPK